VAEVPKEVSKPQEIKDERQKTKDKYFVQTLVAEVPKEVSKPQ
jgi:hypothetical protein